MQIPGQMMSPIMGDIPMGDMGMGNAVMLPGQFPAVGAPPNRMLVEGQGAEEKQPAPESTQQKITQWIARIKRSKLKFKKDFQRMQKNMEFASGLQWDGQQTLDEEKYIANIVLREVNQKVATLYAKNPTAVAERRKRLDFQIYDGNIDSLMQAVQQAQMLQQSGMAVPPQLMAILADYQHGRTVQKLIKRVCETLEVSYQYFVDCHKPDFKEQAKQMVRRAIVCGVAYLRPIFVAEQRKDVSISSVDQKTDSTIMAKRAQQIMHELQEKDLDENSPQVETLKSLLLSLGATQQYDTTVKVAERIEFDFPSSQSIIVDEQCKNLKEFVSARWIAQEYIIPIADVNAIFGTDIKAGTGDDQALVVNKAGTPIKDLNNKDGATEEDPLLKDTIAVYEVFDYTTKTRFYICEGYKDYLMAPVMPWPVLNGFWNHFSLTFNDV